MCRYSTEYRVFIITDSLTRTLRILHIEEKTLIEIVVYNFLQEAVDSNTRKLAQAELEWELQCVLDEMAEESASVSNGNGHVHSKRSTCEQNGTMTHEISSTNGHHTSQTGMCNFEELLPKHHIQQRLQAYRESKQSRIDQFLAHLDNKRMKYLENVCPKVM